MKIKIFIALIILLISLLALTTASQISQVTNSISLEELQTCTTNFYDEIQPIYGNCINYYNYTGCLNTSGPNTDCSLQQSQINFSCRTGELIVAKNSTECKPDNKFTVTIDKGTKIEKKEIDFSDWGACINYTENGCLIVTCQSRYDGANDGQFHGCKGGTSCQKFEICDNKVKTFYQNSRAGFVENDPSFYLNKLPLAEVTK